MKQDQSFGVVVLREGVGGQEVLLVCHVSGEHWGFPKGHAEIGENGQDAAVREVFEETSVLLSVDDLLPDLSYSERYQYAHHVTGEMIDKIVVYFVAVIDRSLPVTAQEEEIVAVRWVPIDEAQELLTFVEAKELLGKVVAVVS